MRAGMKYFANGWYVNASTMLHASFYQVRQKARRVNIQSLTLSSLFVILPHRLGQEHLHSQKQNEGVDVMSVLDEVEKHRQDS